MTTSSLKIICILSLIVLAVAACGPDPNATPIPTRTPLPRFEQVATDTPPPIATSAPTEAAGEAVVELNPTAVARGLGRWEALECASCHGANGEGGADSIGDVEAASLIDLTMTEAEFIDWLRTGGDFGNDHLFSTDRLSDNGGRNLYQYVLSLGE